MIELRRRAGHAGPGGYSLIEMLTASLILSILLVGYTSLFKYSIDAWLRTMNRVDRSQNVNGAIDLMSIDLRSAVPPCSDSTEVKFEGRLTPSGNFTNSIEEELMFHVATYSDVEGDKLSDGGGSGLSKIFYFLKRSGTTDTRIIRGKQNSKIGTTVPPIWNGTGSQDEFAYRIATIGTEYYDGASWQTTWNSTTEGSLPRLVRISMMQRRNGEAYTAQALAHPRCNGTYISK